MTVTNMYANATNLKPIRDNGYGDADFDIKVQRLEYRVDHNEFPQNEPDYWQRKLKVTKNYFNHDSSKFIVYRTDNGSELGIHGDRYHPVAPKDMIENARNIIERSSLNTVGITEDVKLSHNGARCFVKYNFPAHVYDTGDGDQATLSLLCHTSLDGSWPFMISVAATQHACTNLQVFITGGVGIYRAKHTKSLSIKHGANVICQAIDIFTKERDLWKTLKNTKVTDNEAFEFFANAIGANLEIKAGSRRNVRKNPDWLQDPRMRLHLLPRNNSNLTFIWNAYNLTYRNRLGANYWAVYNALTDWSTHAGVTSRKSWDNLASVKNDRQQLVRKAFKTNNFLEVA